MLNEKLTERSLADFTLFEGFFSVKLVFFEFLLTLLFIDFRRVENRNVVAVEMSLKC